MSWNVEDWSVSIVEGTGGLRDYKYHEVATVHPDPHVEGAIWALKCLSNPHLEGSGEALKAVEERRRRLAEEGRTGGERA